MKRSHELLKDENAFHFITTNTINKQKVFLDPFCCEILKEDILFYAKKHNIVILGYVIMPDHLHILIYPQKEMTFIDFMKGIKSYSAKKILNYLRLKSSKDSIIHDGIQSNFGVPGYGWGPQTPQVHLPLHSLWQSSFFNYMTISKETLLQKLEYIKQNPIKAGISITSDEYPWLYINPNTENIFEAYKEKTQSSKMIG